MENSACVLWTGRLDRDGYGRDGFQLAHRSVWRTAHGPIAAGLTVDHLCNVRACVNPAHLELVDRAENLRRSVARRRYCKQGHPFDDRNTYHRRDSGRGCRTCNAEAVRRYRERSKAA